MREEDGGFVGVVTSVEIEGKSAWSLCCLVRAINHRKGV